MTDILISSFIYLAAAVVAVPLFKQLGLGSVLGYLIAGIVIGPLLGLVGDETKQIQHVAEFGVVMMLFIVGLELEPRKLWELRHRLLGLGGLQVILTIGAITLGAIAMGVVWQTALAIGLVLSLSSTAIVLQTLSEKGLMKTSGGQSSFSVLSFQDIAVIFMLAFIPLLALPELVDHASAVHEAGHTSGNLIEGFSGWMRTLITIGAISAIIFIGHFLVNPIFRFIAQTGLREILTSFALCLVIGIAALMSVIGLSPALGTFVAGVVLANSEYRHELESTINPFKGLLLGLFFITVGAGMDLNLLKTDFMTIIGITLAVMAIKFVVLFMLGKVFKLKSMYQWLFALALAQAGEFGFVLLSFTVGNHVIPKEVADQLSLVIALSMMLTPLLFIFFDKVIAPRQALPEREADIIDEHSSVIIVGNGRFGQIVNRALMLSGYKATVLDLDAEAVSGFAKYGIKTFFGDASRPDLLEAAKIKEADVLVVAVDDKQKALEIVEHAHHVNPNLEIIARAYDRNHYYELHDAGAEYIVRETFSSAVRASEATLEALGMPTHKAKAVSQLFSYRDRYALKELADLYDPALPRFANAKIFTAFQTINNETMQMINELLGKDKADELNISSEDENQLEAEIVEATVTTDE